MVHPLDGIRGKIQRADEHIRNLNAEITAFLGENIYSTASEPDHDARESVLRVIGPEPPLRFSVTAGEIIHQLRSSLDHLVWQLVLQNGKTPTQEHQFPICSTLDKYENSRKGGRIKGVSASAAALIQACQPYHKGRDFERHSLWVLREMDNTDKHRLLVVVGAVASLREVAVGREQGDLEIIGLSPPKWPARPTEDGAELLRIRFGEYQPDVKVTGKVAIQIAFDKFGPLSEQPVIQRVQELRDKVVGTIQLFDSEFP